MTAYTDRFGGATIYPSDVSYVAISITVDTRLTWPSETLPSDYPAARIVDIIATTGLTLYLPDATEASPGETILFNNVGSYGVALVDSAGSAVATLGVGAQWQVYLQNNTTAAGAWKVVHYGASASPATAAELAGTGIKAIGSLLSPAMPVTQLSLAYASGITDRAKVFVWVGGADTFTLPVAAEVGDNWFTVIKNLGTGDLTISGGGSEDIDGESTKVLSPGDSAILLTDGSIYYSVGFGQSAQFAFDYTSINVAGGTNHTLSGSELNRVAYKFVGLLTANIDIIVPGTVQQYWVDNATTGAYTLRVITAAGTGAFVTQGARAILYCDGTNVVPASTAGASFPIAINQGGTAATTAGNALINLGGSSVGVALFTAASQAAAWSAMGDPVIIGGGTF